MPLSDEELDALQEQDEKDNGVSLCAVFTQAREANALRGEVERLRNIEHGDLQRLQDENRNHEVRLKEREYKLNQQRAEIDRLSKSTISRRQEIDALRADLAAVRANLEAHDSWTPVPHIGDVVGDVLREREPLVGAYDVLRLRRRKECVVFYARNGAKEHASAPEGAQANVSSATGSDRAGGPHDPPPPVEIARCPWCGSKADWNHTSGGNGDGFSVLCNAFDCGVMGPQFKSKEAAIRAWNRVARAARRGSKRGK